MIDNFNSTSIRIGLFYALYLYFYVVGFLPGYITSSIPL